MKELSSVGRQNERSKIRYYVQEDITSLIGKRVKIDGKVRKVLEAFKWELTSGAESSRYIMIVNK